GDGEGEGGGGKSGIDDHGGDSGGVVCEVGVELGGHHAGGGRDGVEGEVAGHGCPDDSHRGGTAVHQGAESTKAARSITTPLTRCHRRQGKLDLPWWNDDQDDIRSVAGPIIRDGDHGRQRVSRARSERCTDRDGEVGGELWWVDNHL